MQRIGSYVLLEAIARGATGAVYRARHQGLERDVALKLLLSGREASEAQRGRFLREARAVSRLNHPAIVQVQAVEEDQGRPYIVMELVEGESLQRRLDRGDPLPPAEAVELAATLADALAHAHAHQILHRDLKPDNVLLDREGHPRLTDFGLAKDLAPSHTQTVGVEGQIMGTPGYWAPELARGDPAALSPRSDVYGLGAILYAMLTGRPPQGEAETLVEALSASQRTPEPPSTLNPQVDAALDRVVLRCLATDPRRRFADMDAVRDALLGLGARPAPNRAAWIAALLLLAGVTGALGVVAGSTRGAAAPSPAPVAAAPSAPASVRATPTGPAPTGATPPDDAQATPPPADPDARQRAAAAFARARGHQVRGETELALAAFEEVIRVDPRYDAYESRGVIRAARGDTAGALADFARAIELAPSQGTPYCNRGVLRLRTREFGLALVDFDRAVDRALPGELPAFLTNRAEAREHLDDLRGALSDWRRYLELSPRGSYAPLARRRVAALERALDQ